MHVVGCSISQLGLMVEGGVMMHVVGCSVTAAPNLDVSATIAFMRSVSFTLQLPTFLIVVVPSATNATEASVMAASGMSKQSTSMPLSFAGPPTTVILVGFI